MPLSNCSFIRERRREKFSIPKYGPSLTVVTELLLEAGLTGKSQSLVVSKSGFTVRLIVITVDPGSMRSVVVVRSTVTSAKAPGLIDKNVKTLTPKGVQRRVCLIIKLTSVLMANRT